jgi:fructuronate reductase/mannitol 2-dehydrogenase
MSATPAPAREHLALSDLSLPEHASRVRVPEYDRAALTPAVVHIGVGGFHRAHQAVYLDELAQRGLSDWGVVGVTLRRRDAKDALEPQDGLYTVVERDGDGDSARVVGSLLEVLFAPEEPGRVVDALADPRARIASLTITPAGYHVDVETRRLSDDDEIRADLATPDRPATAIGYLVEGLDRRRRAGTAPFTVLSCDNVPGNGDTARSAVVAFARQRDPVLADWIEREVAFPNSMVDRITPATTDELRELVAADYGVDDRWPVATEPFTQWVVEDRFCNDRPPLEEVGVRFVADVEPYELMKKRLLNGSHAALGYVGYLLGHRDSAAAMADPLVHAFIEGVMRDEVTPSLQAVPGVDLDEYRETLLRRFANEQVADQLDRLCRRGSSKVPTYLLPSLVDARTAGRPHELLTLAVAAWVRYLRGTDLAGEEIDINDARIDELGPLAVEGGGRSGRAHATRLLGS